MTVHIRRRTVLQVLAALIAIGAVVLLVQLLPVEGWLERFSRWVAEAGLAGRVVFVLVYTGAAVAFLPGSVLTLGAGFAFGLAWGFALVSLGATLGAAAAFLVARHLARDWVARRFASNQRFAAVDRAVSARGWKIVLLLRLSPAFPFNALNYVLGLTGVRFWPYVLASWIGMLPGTLLYVYLGFAGRAGLEAAADDGGMTSLEMVYLGAGLLATIAVTLYLTRVARQALRQRTDQPALEA